MLSYDWWNIKYITTNSTKKCILVTNLQHSKPIYNESNEDYVVDVKFKVGPPPNQITNFS